ncbi:MAG: DUF192 domain-containing protein [Nitrospirota bacterium]|nr:DUF192 domain-containing protein [Nitrospirota bacterium]
MTNYLSPSHIQVKRMKTFLIHRLARLQKKSGCPLNFHLLVWIILFPLAISSWKGIIPYQNAWGETASLQGKELASISTPKGAIIFAEIADTPDKRAKGLMYRPSIAPDEGMLFQFPELGYWTFWMKNTKIPLDILWLDKTGIIIHIESHVPICTRTDDHCPRYYSHKKSWQVLELKAGMAEELELLPGNQLTISVPKNHIPY